MSFRDFVNKSEKRIAEDGASALPSVALDFVVSALAKAPVLPRYGKNIYSEDWDVLLILDACRWDMYDEVVGRGEPVWSVGSASGEWMDHTFTEEYREEISNTTYITGNPFSEDRIQNSMFEEVDEVWRSHWNDERGTIFPRPITDRVISKNRDGRDRIIGHYMQPHYPFIGEKGEDGGKMTWDIIGDQAQQGRELALWDQFLYGERDDLDEVRKAYYANLRFIVEEVELLLQNLEGTVVITADHGNALGEAGLWGHKPGMLHPKMRRVPWDRRKVADQGTYEPDVEESQVEVDREEQLKSLGYME